jgi:regulator of sirC expression with transglutaminase-like and TPR domain
MTSALEQFAEVASRPDPEIELERAALLLGSIANDGALDLDRCRDQLDQIAERSRANLARLEKSAFAPARAVSITLFNELGYRGNASDYYDPQNSFLHQVLERRLGIPISLSLLYIAVARRLDIDARGVGFPGHFLVRVQSSEDGGGKLIMDPFNGGHSLNTEQLGELLARRNGAGAKLEKAMLEPISNVAILTRMLFNLAGIYGQRNDWSRSLAVLERLAVLDPANQRIARELIDLRARMKTLN